MTPWNPGAVACQACLTLLLLGHEATELAHSTHVCGSPQEEICVDNGAGSRPHVPENLGPVVVPRVVPMREPVTFVEELAVKRVA